MNGTLTDDQIASAFSGYGEYMWESVSEGVEKIKEEGPEAISEVAEDISESYSDALNLEGIEILAQATQEAFKNVDIDGTIDTWKEMSDALADVAETFEKLENAEKEQATYGKLNLKTMLDLLATDADYVRALTVVDNADGTKSIKLRTDAEKILAQAKIATALASAKAA